MGKNKNLQPESQMMGYEYNHDISARTIKTPIFQTSTFEFETAEEGKKYFSKAYGKIDEIDCPMGLIYSRINNPNLEVLEKKLCLWDKTEDCAVFSSGMAGISTTILSLCLPETYILCSLPVYGGTNFFMENILPIYNIKTIYFHPTDSEEEILKRIKKEGAENKLALIYAETPTNPTNQLIDLDMCHQIAKKCSNGEEKTLLTVDNTFMGPLWQKPMEHGADIVLYSATKYIGGHSDLLGGAVLGSQDLIKKIKGMRTFLGNMLSPHDAWLFTRSLETLKVRMEQQAKNAEKIAEFLSNHPAVEHVYYLGFSNDDRTQDIYDRHFSSAGAMISFDIKGGEKEAFHFLDHLELISLAVSLGGTESLAQHPQTMTHTDMPDELKGKSNITAKLIRISVGIENADDLIADIENALAGI